MNNLFNHMGKDKPINLWIISLLVLFVGIWITYILLIDPEMLRSDQFPLVLRFDNLINGNETLFSLWEPKGGHRNPGYQLLFYANLALVGFSPMLEIIIAILVYSISIYFITLILSRAVGFSNYQQYSFALLSVVILTNSQNLWLSIYSLIAMRFFDFTGFLLLTLLAYKLVKPQIENKYIKNTWLLFISALIICILLFGRGWGMAVTSTLIIMVVFHSFSRSHQSRETIISDIFIISALLISMIIYTYELKGSSHHSSFDFVAFTSYYLIKLGNANLSMLPGNIGVNPIACNIFAILYLITTSIICYRLIYLKKFNSASWVALFLILFSLCSTGLVALSRYDLTPFYPRHNFELSVGFLGIAYFLVQSFFSSTRRYNSCIAISLIAIVIGSIGLKTYSDILSYGYIKNYHQRIENLSVELFSRNGNKSEFKKIGCNLSNSKCDRVFFIMKQRGILNYLNNKESY